MSFYDSVDSKTRSRIDTLRDLFEDRIRSDQPIELEALIERVPAIELPAYLEELLPVEIYARYISESKLVRKKRLLTEHPTLAEAIRQVYPYLPTDLCMPSRLGDFVLTKAVNAGSQGVKAHAVEEDDPSIRVFIKYVDNRWPQGDAFAVKQEADFLEQLRHGNIVKRLQAKDEQPFTFLVTEFQPKHFVDLRLGDRVLAEPEKIADLFLQLCDACVFIHSRRVVHCDVKPLNIMMTEYDAPILIDFGLAIDLSKAMTPVIKLSDEAGTKQFMAPEQRDGIETDLPYHRDIFSLGGTLGWLLTGKCPGPTHDDLIEFGKALRTVPRTLRPFVSVVLKATQEDPIERYDSAKEMREALKLASFRIHTRKARASRITYFAASVFIVILLALGFWAARIKSPIAMLGYRKTDASKIADEMSGLRTAVNQLAEQEKLARPGVGRFASEMGNLRSEVEELADSAVIAQTSWIDLLATERNLDIHEITKDSFSLKFDFSSHMRNVFSAGMIEISIDDKYFDFTQGLEYRIGKGLWRTVTVDPHGTILARLLARDMEAAGPLQLQIDDVPGYQTGRKVIGPFTYDINLNDEKYENTNSRLIDIPRRRIALMQQEWLQYDGSWTATSALLDNANLVRGVMISERENFKSRGTTLHPDSLVTELGNLPHYLRRRDSLFVTLVFGKDEYSPTIEIFRPVRWRRKPLSKSDREIAVDEVFEVDRAGRRAFSSRFVEHWSAYVSAVAIGKDRSDLSISIPIDLSAAPMPKYSPARFEGSENDLHTNLIIRARDLLSNQSIFIQLVFADGSTSPVREHASAKEQHNPTSIELRGVGKERSRRIGN